MIQSLRRPALVVVGTGMAAAKFVESLHERSPDRFQIRMFGAESNGTYNRILLSSLLGGDAEPSRLWTNPLTWYEDRGVFVHSGIKADSIDRERRVVIGAGGKVVEPYDVLVLATGSRPLVPPIEGLKQPGVFLFRTVDDCDQIAAYAQDCRRVAVLGGGLLGLEAARGLTNFGLEVTVVEMASQLMPQQLDAAGSEVLQRKLESLGLRFRLGARTTRLETIANGKRLHFVPSSRGIRAVDHAGDSADDFLDTDMVVVSCGIEPNIAEARAAGLRVERGIVVDDQLRTNDHAIFAIGECAQHRGKVYGLVDPGYDQARILADLLSDARPTAVYTGSRLATTLKVLDVDLLALGDVHVRDGQAEVISHLDATRGIYKKLVIRDGKL